MESEAVVFMAMTVIVMAGIVLIWMAVTSRRHIREMAHRERLAMIERGLVPPPEVDPAAFEGKTGLARSRRSQASARMRSAGVIMVGFGLALLVLISFAGGSPGIGVGIGGAFVVLGLAFFFNAFMMTVDDEPVQATSPPLPQRLEPREPRPPDPS